MIIKKICEKCEGKYEIQDWRKSKFCSHKCANSRPNSSRFKKGYKESNEIKLKRKKALKGKIAGIKHWNYIDGRSKLVSPRRYGDDWEAVRMLIYLRDKFTCQKCGITMKENKRSLDVHHKIPFLVSFDNSLSNLITLCASCHKKIEAPLIKQMKEENMIGGIK